MTRRAPDRLRAGRFEVAWGATLLRALVGSLVALALGGCAMLPFFGDKKDDAEKAEPLVEQYDIEVDAPAPLKTLLLEYLDVSRFQKAPRSEAVTSSELDRLAAVVPAQAKTLLETEGYFSADVTIARSDPPGALPLLKITVVPGPRVEVARVAIDATAPLAPHQPSREEPWGDRLDHIRSVWPLKPGQPFRQPAWSSAKTSTLAAVRADAYPTATWKETHALVDATANTAALELTLEPGPLITSARSASRASAASTRPQCGGSRPSSPAPAQRAAAPRLPGPAAQARTLRRRIGRARHERAAGRGAGHRQGQGADPAPGQLRHRLQRQHRSAHVGRALRPQGVRAAVGLALDADLRSRPEAARHRADVVPSRGHVAQPPRRQHRAAARRRRGAQQQHGARRPLVRLEPLRTAGLCEITQARVDNAALTDKSVAASLNYHWLQRDVDNILQPTVGSALSLQGGGGYGSGREQRTDRPGEETSKGPFLRAYTRYNYYRPFGGWYANARVEAGQVFVHSRIAVPDTILFRAGGDNSVRGYGYRTLGPRVNGVVVGGRVETSASVELEHVLTERLPSLFGALFVDAGNAADRWNELRPVVGVGTGLHYRSPVGPLRLDVAYGVNEQRWRLHLSVGVTFAATQ
jgi:translocation and assembly module TamA